MAVYIDRGRRFNADVLTHFRLTANKLDELHEFAVKLGLPLDYFSASHQCYDLPLWWGYLAGAKGAISTPALS